MVRPRAREPVGALARIAHQQRAAAALQDEGVAPGTGVARPVHLRRQIADHSAVAWLADPPQVHLDAQARRPVAAAVVVGAVDREQRVAVRVELAGRRVVDQAGPVLDAGRRPPGCAGSAWSFAPAPCCEKPAASGARQVSRTDSQLVAERRLLASAGATPLPPRPTLKSGPASFATTSVANLPPSLRGANRTFTVQVPPGAIAGPVQRLLSQHEVPRRCAVQMQAGDGEVGCPGILDDHVSDAADATQREVGKRHGRRSCLDVRQQRVALERHRLRAAGHRPVVVGEGDRRVRRAGRRRQERDLGAARLAGLDCALPQSPVPALVKVASPVRVAPATSSTALPVLVSVTALVCGTFRGVAKLTEASTEACGTAPLPVRLTAVVGVAGSLLEMDSTPVLGPALAGEKVTVMSQPPAGGTVPHPLLLTANSPVDPTVVSEADTVATTRSASPAFVTCTVLPDEVVPTF